MRREGFPGSLAAYSSGWPKVLVATMSDAHNVVPLTHCATKVSLRASGPWIHTCHVMRTRLQPLDTDAGEVPAPMWMGTFLSLLLNTTSLPYGVARTAPSSWKRSCSPMSNIEVFAVTVPPS